jgi:hypothetical protein
MSEVGGHNGSDPLALKEARRQLGAKADINHSIPAEIVKMIRSRMVRFDIVLHKIAIETYSAFGIFLL